MEQQQIEDVHSDEAIPSSQTTGSTFNTWKGNVIMLSHGLLR